ncbi:MAG TPA: S8 family serine peptidase [Actinomycetota bacterium]|nr:S8 family serine peptidase [Actinomycetota bacterium]
MRRLRTESLLTRRILGVGAALLIAVVSALVPNNSSDDEQGGASRLSRFSSGLRVGGGAGQSGEIAQRYIVIYRGTVRDPKAKTDRLQGREGFRAAHRYKNAVKGFAAKLSARQLERLRTDPDVAFIAEDRAVKAVAPVPLATGDSAPTGVRRMEAATATTAREASGAHVAVVDSGVDLDHPDLNVIPGVNCINSGASPDDDNGHGTHVAGSIAAKNNGSGVVGVAPATRVYAVKVLDSGGSGSWSSVICGIDWVTGTRSDGDPSNDIAVANLSLGGPGTPIQSCSTTTDPLHRAVCASTAAGVVYVVAAGNSGWDFDYPSEPDTPAAYPEALTVTAVADSDGLPGGSGGTACNQSDDKYASFSNYAATTAGAAHTIAGPGVCIRSTYPGGGYASMSGTSMATPHVAGAVALCLVEAGIPGPCAGLSPPQIIAKMRSIAEAQTASSTGYGFTGDPVRPVQGRYYGYLSWAGLAPAAPAPDATAPSVTSVSPPDGSTGVSTGARVAVTFDEPMDKAATESAFSLVNSTDGAEVGGSFSWSGNTMTFAPSSLLQGGTTYAATVGTGAADAAGNQLEAERTWSFKTVSAVTKPPAAATVQSGKLRAGTYANLGADDNVYFQVTSTSSGTRTTSWYGTIKGVTNSLRTLSVTYKGKNSATCSQTIYVYNWSNSSWVTVDSRSVGTTEVLVEKSPSGTLASYVSGSSGDGDVRVRVRCTKSSGFYTSADLVTITFSAP